MDELSVFVIVAKVPKIIKLENGDNLEGDLPLLIRWDLRRPAVSRLMHDGNYF